MKSKSWPKYWNISDRLHAQAKVELAQMFANGEGGSKNEDEAVALLTGTFPMVTEYEKADVAKICYDVARVYYYPLDKRSARAKAILACITDAVVEAYPSADLLRGYVYYEGGTDVPKNPDRAQSIFEGLHRKGLQKSGAYNWLSYVHRDRGNEAMEIKCLAGAIREYGHRFAQTDYAKKLIAKAEGNPKRKEMLIAAGSMLTNSIAAITQDYYASSKTEAESLLNQVNSKLGTDKPATYPTFEWNNAFTWNFL